MSHQVQVDYKAIAVRCESICEVAEKQIEELGKMLAEVESGSQTLMKNQAIALKDAIEEERDLFRERIHALRTQAKEVAKKGVVIDDGIMRQLNFTNAIEELAQNLKKQINTTVSKRIVEMRALLQALLAENIEENERRLRNRANSVVAVTSEVQELLASIPDEVERQFTYLAYLKDDRLSGEALINAGIKLKNESYELRIEKERESIRRELEAAKLEKATIDKVVSADKPLSEIRAAATEEIVGEKVRQKSLKIIMSAISARGFVVDKKNIKIKRDTNEVILIGLKASGEKAEFRVFLDGKFIYDFRGYQGQACQKDIQPFLKDLEEVYGLHVTKTQEIWSNPDKISGIKHQTIKTNTNKG